MKELKRERTIEEVYGYEAEDGKIFKTKEECINYEQSAKAVIEREFNQLIVGEKFYETYIWENFGYGSDEYEMAVIEIKDINDLMIANRYYEINDGKLIDKKYIGQKILVNIGYDYDSVKQTNPQPRTQEELLEQFKNTIDEFFNPKKGEE